MRRTFLDHLHKLEEGALAFLLAAMVIITFSQVVARYVFNTGAIWALELTTYAFAWLVILGMSYGIRIHGHIGVDAFVKLFNQRIQRILGLLAVASSLAYAGLLLYGAWDQTFGIIYTFEIETEDLKIPLWVPLSVMVVGFSTMIVRLLLIGWKIATHAEGVSLLADESREAIEQFKDQGGDAGLGGRDA